VFDGIPTAMPALLYAFKVLGKAHSIGETIEPAPVGDGDIGAALLTVVAAARALDVDPEGALRAAADELRDRAAATERGRGG
jgi:XTP/dITP diphosphohydrolase